MIIGFIGAASTGKTSVAREITKETGMTFHPSVSREVFKEFGVTEVDQHKMPIGEVYRLQQAIFARKVTQDKSVKEGIFDRTPTDQLAYTMIRCHGVMTTESFEDHFNRMAEGLKLYDLLFFFPVSPNIKYENDGFREASGDAYRFLQQFTMRGLLHKCGVQYHLITPNSSVRARVRTIMQAIKIKQKAANNDSDNHSS